MPVQKILEQGKMIMAGVFHADEDIPFPIRAESAVKEVKALPAVGEISGFHKNFAGVFGDDGKSMAEFADVDSD